MRTAHIVPAIIALCVLTSALVYTIPEISKADTTITDITATVNWTKAGGPYLLITNVHVTNNAVLTIEPGTVVKFNDDGVLTIDSGSMLKALGNASEPIQFISNNMSDANLFWNGVVLSSTGNIIEFCNFSQADISIKTTAQGNTVGNCVFNDTTTAILLQSQKNRVYNCSFSQKVQTAIMLEIGANNFIDNCNIKGVPTGIDIKTGSNNIFINETLIVGATTGIKISGSSNIQINDSALINCGYGILSDAVSTLNDIHNSTLLVAREYCIKSPAAMKARNNYWGIVDPTYVPRLVSGSVDVGSALAADVYGLTIPTVSSATTWSTPQTVTGGLVVASDLTISGTKVTFSDPAGYNFMFVTGELTMTGTTLEKFGDPYTILFAPGSSIIISDSSIYNSSAFLGFTSNMSFANTTFGMSTTAVTLRGGDNASFEGCSFYGNSMAISSSESKGLGIKGCTITDPVALSGADLGLISGNMFNNSYLTLSGTEWCNVTDNSFFNLPSGYGLTLSGSKENIIYRNTFKLNKGGCQLLSGSNLNSLYENEFMNNTDAQILITGSNTNTIYHNNFYMNGLISTFDSDINHWNTSDGEGNHWAEYDGLDDGTAGKVRGDGIGDTNVPYLGLDNYPFIYAYGWLYPKTPALTPFNYTVDTDGSYNISWTGSLNADRYVLMEDTTAGFGNSAMIYNGTGNKTPVQDKTRGTYYYRLKACNELGSSMWSNVISMIVNRIPVATENVITITLDEDGTTSALNLTSAFSDPDDDKLIFTADTPTNLTLSIFADGMVTVVSAKSNWFGSETVRFYAMDGMFTVNRTLDFVVLPVNDAPGIPKINIPTEGQYFEHWELVNFTGTCTDIDTASANLTYTWSSNISGELGTGPSLRNYTLAPGWHKITLTVSDGEFSKETTRYIMKKPKPMIIDVIPPEPEDNTALYAGIAVAVVIFVIIIGVIIYFMIRKRSIEKHAEVSKEESKREAEEKVKKITAKVPARQEPILAPEPPEPMSMPPGMPEPGIEQPTPMEQPMMESPIAVDAPSGPAGPVIEEAAPSGPAGGGLSAEEKQKKLNELDDLLFNDKITEEEYINKVNEIESM